MLAVRVQMLDDSVTMFQVQVSDVCFILWCGPFDSVLFSPLFFCVHIC
jgi:hypothetical protein